MFIGIQVANWNDSRIDKGRAVAYLEQVAEHDQLMVERQRRTEAGESRQSVVAIRLIPAL
ncbi:MAG: hypothetical protein HND55_10570 [Pseudomonadota bacterium]|nr:MAG: hypothetical protein HND55_10570 [Pseudomonadota bacterium]